MSSLPSSIYQQGDQQEPNRRLSRQSSLSFSSKPRAVLRQTSSASYKSMEKVDGPSAEDDTEVKQKPSVFGTRRKKVVLFSISLYWFTVNCAYAMIAPFFPGEAQKQGSNNTTTGLIFAVFALVMFVFSPVIGVVMPIVGPKFTLMCGLFVEGGAQVLFGFLDLMPHGKIFIIFCFLVRIVSALGATATSTASMTLLVQNFHENISPAMGVMETFGGFGMMAGPPIGGFLYAAGGFKMPFLVLGGIILLSIIPIFCVMPPDNEDGKQDEANKGALWQALQIPAVTIVALLTAVGGMALSFLEPTLQGHLQKPFHLNSSQIGLMFLIAPGIYAFLAPAVGFIADKKDTRLIMIIGGIIMAVSYILLGPTPFIPTNVIPNTLWLNGVALALLGIGVGPFLVPGLSDMNASAVRYGMAGDLSTHSALSSIFNAMFSIGAIAGPTLGGILVEYTDFAWASAIFGFFILLWALILAVFTICERRSLRKKGLNEDSKPLLENA